MMRHVPRALSRRLSGSKAEPAGRLLALPAAPEEPRRGGEFADCGGAQASTIRYNVCKEQSSPGRKFVFETRPVINVPAEEDARSLGRGDHVPHNPNSSVAKGYRPFESSKTQKNVLLPLKYSKLSSPFPEPVKVMPSHRVSDMEKADQAQAEFRVPRAVTRTK